MRSEYWAENLYWTHALDRYQAAQTTGRRQITIDLDALDTVIYDGDGPAYRAMGAFSSVLEHEGWDGYRGAPRVLLALLQVLGELRSD